MSIKRFVVFSHRIMYILCIACVAGPNDGDCCTADHPCEEGGGDCDSDDHCLQGLVCGVDNCVNFHTNTLGWKF